MFPNKKLHFIFIIFQYFFNNSDEKTAYKKCYSLGNSNEQTLTLYLRYFDESFYSMF